MVFKSHAAAVASLKGFTPEMRKQHEIVCFFSEQENRFMYSRRLASDLSMTRNESANPFKYC